MHLESVHLERADCTVTFKTESMFDNFSLDTQFLSIHLTKSTSLKEIRYYIHFSTFMQDLKGIWLVAVEKINFKIKICIDSVLNVVHLFHSIIHPRALGHQHSFNMPQHTFVELHALTFSSMVELESDPLP